MSSAQQEAQKIIDLQSFKILEIEMHGAASRATIQYKHNIIGFGRGTGFAQWEKGGETHYITAPSHHSTAAFCLADDKPKHSTITGKYKVRGISGGDIASALLDLIMVKINRFIADQEQGCKAWKGRIQELILRNGLTEAPFTIQGFLNLSDIITGKSIHTTLGMTFTKSNTIKASVLGNLQKLRDEGFIRFIDNKGKYEVTRSSWSGPLQEKHSGEATTVELYISSDDEEFGSFVRNYHSSGKGRGERGCPLIPRPKRSMSLNRSLVS